MTMFGFGQRVGQIVQRALHGTRAAFPRTPATADIKLAMSFAGHMNIELIQPKGRGDSTVFEAPVPSGGPADWTGQDPIRPFG